jgi:hypothetical protein
VYVGVEGASDRHPASPARTGILGQCAQSRNARDARPGRGSVAVRREAVRVDEGAAALATDESAFRGPGLPYRPLARVIVTGATSGRPASSWSCAFAVSGMSRGLP